MQTGSSGVLQQCATPRELYDEPVDVFVAGFIGSPAMNLVDLPLVDGGVAWGDTHIPVRRDLVSAVGRVRAVSDELAVFHPETGERIAARRADRATVPVRGGRRPRFTW